MFNKVVLEFSTFMLIFYIVVNIVAGWHAVLNGPCTEIDKPTEIRHYLVYPGALIGCKIVDPIVRKIGS